MKHEKFTYVAAVPMLCLLWRTSTAAAVAHPASSRNRHTQSPPPGARNDGASATSRPPGQYLSHRPGLRQRRHKMTASLVVPIAIQFAGVRGEELREMARYKVLYFFHAVVWHQGAVRMRISSDQQRYFLFQFPAIEQNHSFISGTQKIAGFESQPE
jgi:hypothetical protein